MHGGIAWHLSSNGLGRGRGIREEGLPVNLPQSTDNAFTPECIDFDCFFEKREPWPITVCQFKIQDAFVTSNFSFLWAIQAPFSFKLGQKC
jgi:hypothetical protein